MHAGEGLCRLHQAAQCDLAAEIARQRDDQRHDGREIGQRAGEQGQVALAAGLDVPGGAQVEERAAQPFALVVLAAHQGDAFGVLARARQAGPEVGLPALADIAGVDEATAEEIGEQRADQRIGDRGPDHVARQVELEAEQPDRHRARQDPQHAEEGEELQHALQDALGELDRVFGRDADVLGDAAVGIVDLVGQHAELVLATRVQPALDRDVRQPGPPVDLQPPLDVELDRHRHAGRHDDGRQDPEQLHELPDVTLVERVEEVAVPDVQP